MTLFKFNTMVKVQGNLELSREAEETSDMASYILGRLKVMEGDHPYLKPQDPKEDYPEYISLRRNIEQAYINPPKREVLGMYFDKLRECLHRISDERNAQISAIGQAHILIPRNYLPMSFDLLLQDFAELGFHEGAVFAVNDTVEDVLFGDVKIEEVTTSHRDRIKAKVLKALVSDYGMARQIREDLEEQGPEVFELLKLSDDELNSVLKESGEGSKSAVASIIIRTRGYITHGRGVHVKPEGAPMADVVEIA